MALTVMQKGISLKDIIEQLGDKDYEQIIFRYKVHNHEGEEIRDEYFGLCSYIGGKFRSLDGDHYSLDELFFRYEEHRELNDSYTLLVWQYACEE